jgi:predicted Zn-dependent peptidase
MDNAHFTEEMIKKSLSVLASLAEKPETKKKMKELHSKFGSKWDFNISRANTPWYLQLDDGDYKLLLEERLSATEEIKKAKKMALTKVIKRHIPQDKVGSWIQIINANPKAIAKITKNGNWYLLSHN